MPFPYHTNLLLLSLSLFLSPPPPPPPPPSPSPHTSILFSSCIPSSLGGSNTKVNLSSLYLWELTNSPNSPTNLSTSPSNRTIFPPCCVHTVSKMTASEQVMSVLFKTQELYTYHVLPHGGAPVCPPGWLQIKLKTFLARPSNQLRYFFLHAVSTVGWRQRRSDRVKSPIINITF